MCNQMVVEQLTDAQADRIFRALADATRRDIVSRTLRAEATVSELAADYDMSFAAVQKHVSVLEAADLVRKTPRGRERIVSAAPETLQRTRELLGAFETLWRGRIDRLDDLLGSDAAPPPPK